MGSQGLAEIKGRLAANLRGPQIHEQMPHKVLCLRDSACVHVWAYFCISLSVFIYVVRMKYATQNGGSICAAKPT